MPRGTMTAEILRGTVRWCKLFAPSKYNKWSLELCLDNESLSKALELKKKGIKNNIKKDEDGYWLTLSRNCEIKRSGKLMPNTPPTIVDADGKPWDRNIHIGNGSSVACRVIVATYTVPIVNTPGIAVRLDGVKITQLVPWERDRDFGEEEKKQTEGLQDEEVKPW